MTVDTVDRHALEHDRVAVPAVDRDAGRRLAFLGRPLPGFELRIVDPRTGQVRGEREVGELELRGPSVTPGVLPQPGGDRGRASTTGGCAPATSPTSWTAASSCAADSRT